MKLPLSWLKEYVDIKESAENLAESLQLSGTKVDSVEKKDGEEILDFEITPNRPDCLGAIGIAREIAAIYDQKLSLPPAFAATNQLENPKQIQFSVTDPNLCPTYSIGAVDNLKVGKSPEWLKKRLALSGIRSLNNIIDITNFVMLETGQPMHAFDYHKVVGEMRLRAAKKGEVITTLDGVKRDIPFGAIVIEDTQKLIDLAGLMGGQESEIDKNTTSIILHVPIYDPSSIRKSSQALGLRTEASGRFEKRLDPAGHRFAFERALELLRSIAGGRLVTEIKSPNYPSRTRKITLHLELVARILGVEIEKHKVDEILQKLGFLTRHLEKEILEVGIPTFRTDVQDPIDLVEEIGRIYGYNNLPKTLPSGEVPGKPTKGLFFERRLKEILVSIGFNEVVGNPLTSRVAVENIGFDSEKALKVQNRLSVELEFLRPTLFLTLIESAKNNRANTKSMQFFEFGRVFGKDVGEFNLPNQRKKIGILALKVDEALILAQSTLRAFFEKLNIKNFTVEPLPKNSTYRSLAQIQSKEKIIGSIGSVNDQVLKKFGLDLEGSFIELDLETIRSLAREVTYSPLPKFPLARENTSIFVPGEINFSQVQSAIKKAAGENLYRLEILEDKNIKGKRSLLLEITYLDKSKTLDKAKLEAVHKIVNKYLEDLGVEIREN